jgi:uncharacterized membrane protein
MAEPRASDRLAATTPAARAARRRRELHRWFDVGVVFKGLEGLVEIVAGAWFAFDPTVLHTLIFRLTAKELLHDPQDRIAGFLRDMAEHLGSGRHTFAVVYLVAHGVVKVALAAGLLTNRRWAFPFALWTLVAFAVYQVYRYTHTHSIALPVLAAVDIAIAWLVWREGRARATMLAPA